MDAWDSFTGEVEVCEGEGGWHTVAVPQELGTSFKDLPKGNFGYIAITARIASSEWETSFLPVGDGTYFLAIPAKVRKKQQIAPGDKVTVEFSFRGRPV